MVDYMPKPNLTVFNAGNIGLQKAGGKLTIPNAKLDSSALTTFKDKFGIPDKFGLNNTALTNTTDGFLQMNPLMRTHALAKPFIDIFVVANQLLQDVLLVDIKNKLDECLDCDKDYEYKEYSLPYLDISTDAEGKEVVAKKILKTRVKVKKVGLIPNPLTPQPIDYEKKFLENYEYALTGYNDPFPFYGIPITSFQQNNKFKPQVVLYFRQSTSSATASVSGTKAYPVETQISFRLMDAPSSEAELKTIANKIKNTFKDVKYTTGKSKWSYWIPEQGYQLKISCDSEANCKTLVQKVLTIQNHTFKESAFNQSSDKKETTQETVQILGQQVTLPKERKIGLVEFYKAEYHHRGIAPKILVNFGRPKKSLATGD